MSTSPESDLDLDKLFLPAWAQESPAVNRYAKYTGGEDRPERRDDRQRRPGRRDSSPAGGRGFGPGSDRRPGSRPDDRGRRAHAGPLGADRRVERPALLPLPELNVILMPDERGVDSLARQIKMTGRAYPLFDIAQMILQKPERQQVKFEAIRKDGKAVQPLFLCALDDSLWLSEAEAVNHVLEKHFATFYQAEKTPTEAPKGTYTFVAQCGMSGIILGPPNNHDYQNQLRRLHAERFARMPFEAFKARVKIVKDEAVVKKWIEDQSFKTEYVCLNVPEPRKLSSREEVEKHFRETHVPNIIKEVDSHLLSGPASRQLRSPPLQRLLRHAWEEQKRFPIQVVNVLSHQFAQRGLQFFKVNKTITHVAIARPHFLDMEATPVSEGVRKIVDFINTHPRCTRRDLVETLSPTPASSATPPAAVAEVPASAAEPTPEQTVVIRDLHWLIHQGHVIEFATGILETAKRPTPKPVSPPKKTAVQSAPVSETMGAAMPNASVEEISPAVAELEAARPEGSAGPEAAAVGVRAEDEAGTASVGGSGKMGLTTADSAPGVISKNQEA